MIVEKFGLEARHYLNASTNKRWREIVGDYSGLAFTNLIKDRLVVLAGVAYEYGQILVDFERRAGPSGCIGGTNQGKARYVSGIWLRDVSDLLWEQSLPGSSDTRWRVSGIPTWSWASVASRAVDGKGQKIPYAGTIVRWPNFRLHNGVDVATIRKATAITVDE